MTDTDWKARAEELERELNDWRNGDLRGVQAHWHAAEARVKELKARLTVTDEMIERAKKAITETLLALHESDDAWVGEVTSNSLTVDGLVNVERLARAALTAALERRNDI